ncbi:MAG: hypothetical protein M1825_001535 [Sarcosagium campestre]|nr:MAG: hypothetical protein M1825_001535 [Sarcosagium campestre]
MPSLNPSPSPKRKRSTPRSSISQPSSSPPNSSLSQRQATLPFRGSPSFASSINGSPRSSVTSQFRDLQLKTDAPPVLSFGLDIKPDIASYSTADDSPLRRPSNSTISSNGSSGDETVSPLDYPPALQDTANKRARISSATSSPKALAEITALLTGPLSSSSSSPSSSRVRRKSPPPPPPTASGPDSDGEDGENNTDAAPAAATATTAGNEDVDVDSDDGLGINGIGFRPTAATAYARNERRRQQIMEYRSREARDARRQRTERRRLAQAARFTESSSAVAAAAAAAGALSGATADGGPFAGSEKRVHFADVDDIHG